MSSQHSPRHDEDPIGQSPWLSVRAVAKRYGGVDALRRVDVDFAANHVYGIIGPNGAGKSTLMKVLSGSVQPDRGEIWVDGAPASLSTPSLALAHGVVLMPQELTVVPEFTVADNIMLGAEATRVGLRSRSAGRCAAQKAMTTVGLDVDPSMLTSLLSPVEQRLLMLAKAVSRDIRLLILDEPTAGLPATGARLVTETVRRLRDHGLTIAYVSHHLSEVVALCDHVICIREGTVTTRLSGGEITKDALVDAVVGTVNSTSTRMSVHPWREPPSSELPSGEGLTLDNVSGTRLRRVSFTARRGEVTGVTGLLGSGISELTAFVAGSARPVHGEIRLSHRTIPSRSPADALDHGIGTVTGDRSRSALASRTIRENVSVTSLGKWFGRMGFIRRSHEREQVSRALSSLSVTGEMERPFSTLSGGNQQRVLVGRLLAADLEVMLFDDPTVGVDVASRAELWRQLRRLAPGRVILLASGEAEELVAVCDRVVCLRDGSVSEILDGASITEHALAKAIA